MQRTILLFIFLILVPTSVPAAEEVVKIDTRPNVTLNLLIVSPTIKAETALIMFPGGSGHQQFEITDGVISKGNNFLLRTAPDFAKKGFLIVVVDAPSDRQREGMDDDFRMSKDHLQDTLKVVDYLTTKGYKSIYLVGTSRGTVSAAYLASELKHPNISGLVLTSTMRYSKYLRWIALNKVTCRVLIVHHRDDGCKLCPFDEASDMVTIFKQSPRVDFEGVTGGLPPKSDPCKPLSPHGYFGVESVVVDKISQWILRTKS